MLAMIPASILSVVLQPNASVRYETSGAIKKVPAPEPLTASPFFKESIIVLRRLTSNQIETL